MDIATGDAFRDTWRPELDVAVTDIAAHADVEVSSPIIETLFTLPLDDFFSERFPRRNLLRGMISVATLKNRTDDPDIRQGFQNHF